MDIVDIATILSSVIALIGLLIQYISFKSQIASLNTTVVNLRDIIHLYQQTNTTTGTYNNCTIISSPMNDNQVSQLKAKESIND